jgi:hypothetical protein
MSDLNLKHLPADAPRVRLVNKKGDAREAHPDDKERIAWLEAKGFRVPTPAPAEAPAGELAPADPASEA